VADLQTYGQEDLNEELSAMQIISSKNDEIAQEHQ